MHTLFDLGLFRIDPTTYTVALSPILMSGSYASLADGKLHLPRLAALFPDPEALEVHGEQFHVSKHGLL